MRSRTALQLSAILAVGACTAEDTTGIDTFDLTAAQCSYAAVDGKVQICHATPSNKHPYRILTLTENTCALHAAHGDDYIAINDPSCGGGGCLPVDAPCDATVPCCDGSSCTAGTCTSNPPQLQITDVLSMVTDTGGGIYTTWIGAWFGVTSASGGERFGVLLPFDEPNTPTIEDQFYFDELTSPTPSVLSVGPSNGGFIPAQIITMRTESGTIRVHMPELVTNDCVRTRLYVAPDGSTYHSRADHDYTYSVAKANIFTEQCFGQGVVGPDMTPEQAFVPQHLARAAEPAPPPPPPSPDPVATSVSRVSSLVTDTGGGVYYNWLGAWSGVTSASAGDRLGYLLPFDEPNTPTVENQFYQEEMTSPTPSILAIGPSNGGFIPAQILHVVTDTGSLDVYMPALNPTDCVRTRLYVAADGSTYHSRSDHDYTYAPAKANIFTELCFGQGVVGPDLTPAQALVPQHLARAAP